MKNKLNNSCLSSLKQLSLGLLLCSQVTVAEARLNYDVDLSVISDSNINNSLISAEERSDISYKANASLVYSKRINKVSSASVSGFVNYTGFSEYDGLNNSQIGATGTYNFKPYAGFSQPTYIFTGNLSSFNFATDLRDSNHLKLNAIASSWLTDKLSMRGGMGYQLNDSASRVYDTSDIRFFINADLLLNRRTTLYSTFDYITGDIVSTLSINNFTKSTLDIIDLADDIESDPTFDDNEVSYRIKADTITMALGINVVIAKKQSVDFFVRSVSSSVDSNISYQRLILSLSYLARF